MLQRWLTRSQVCSAPRGMRFYRTKGSRNKKTLEREKQELPSLLPSREPFSRRNRMKEMAIITHGQKQHNDLESFIAYAKYYKVNPDTASYRGTYYEYMVQESLERFGLDLLRVGKKGDMGIDLMGWWRLPGTPIEAKPIKVLLQCKAFSDNVGPRYIRELEGSMPNAPHRWQGDGVFGFLVATCEATKGMREAMIKSQLPLGFMQITIEGKILQMLWNYKANLWGLEGYGVATRFSPWTSRSKSWESKNEEDYDVEIDGLGKEVVLTKDGVAIEAEESAEQMWREWDRGRS